MKNFVFACLMVAVLVIGAAISSVTVGSYTEKTVSLLEAGEYQAAYELFEQRKTLLSVAVGGGDLKSLEENLTDLVNGVAGAKEKAISVCEEIGSRQRIGIKSLF